MRFGSNGSQQSRENSLDSPENSQSTRSILESLSNSPRSDSSPLDKAINDIRETINKKKREGRPTSEDERLRDVLLHKKQIKQEQKDYLISIKKSDNREALLEKLVKVDRVVDKYGERYVQGKISSSEFKIKQDETIKTLRDFLGNLEKHVSLDEVAAKIMGTRTKKDGKPLISGRTTGVVEIPPLKQPRVKHSPRPEPVSDDAFEAPKPKIRQYRSRIMQNLPRERPEIKITQEKEKPKVRPRRRASPIQEKYPPVSIAEIERQDLLKKKKSPPKKTGILLKPARDISTMSAQDIENLFKQLGLKLPRGTAKNMKTKTRRKMIQDYYENVKPVRRVTAKTKLPLAPPRVTKKIKLPKRIKVKAAKRVTVPVAKVDPAKKLKQTDEVFNPYYPKHNRIKKVKGKGWVTYEARPLGKIVYISTGKEKQYDPRPSWDWKPENAGDKIMKEYAALRKELLDSISKQSEGNQFTLAHHIEWCHRVLQTSRAEIGKMKTGRKITPLDKKAKAILAAAKRKVRPDSNNLRGTNVKKPLIITMSGQIRPGQKATARPRLLKRVPVEVLEAPIPEYYSRVEMIIIPAHISGKTGGAGPKGHAAQEQRVIRKLPNWNDVPATGFKTTTKNTVTRDVTMEDLETYLGKTYQLGYQNTVHGGSYIKISEADRIYAYQRGIDLRTIRGTYLVDPREPGAFQQYIITRENLDNSLSRGANVAPTAPGTDPDTAEERERKIMKAAMDRAKYIYQVAQQAKAKVTLIRAGKKTVAKKTETMTMEQYEKVLSGKMEPIAGFTTEMYKDVIKKLQSVLEQMISAEASLVDEKNRATMKVNIEQVVKFIENVKKGQVKSPPKIKRRGVKRVVAGAQYMRMRGVVVDESSPSKSTTKSTSSSPSPPPKPKSPPKPVKLKIPPRKMNAEETLILNHFETLDLDPTATTPQLTRAYRRLAMKVHPDKNTSPRAQEKFIQLKESYDFLKEPAARTRQTMDKLAAETKEYNDRREKTPPKAKPEPKAKAKSPTETQLKKLAFDFVRNMYQKEGNCDTLTKGMIKRHLVGQTTISKERIGAWLKDNLDDLLKICQGEGSKKSKSSSSTPSSLSDLVREFEEDLARSKKKTPSDEKKAKAVNKGAGTETIQQMLKRLKDEEELRKKGVKIPKRYKGPPPTDVTKPMAKAYPGVHIDDLFGGSPTTSSSSSSSPTTESESSTSASSNNPSPPSNSSNIGKKK